MVDPELLHTAALAALRKAEADYAAAETKLIEAQRVVQTTRRGTKYYKMMVNAHSNAE